MEPTETTVAPDGAVRISTLPDELLDAAPAPVPQAAPPPVFAIPRPQEQAEAADDATGITGSTLQPDDLATIVDAANELGGPYAPFVAVALAGIAVLGGGKAWSFYQERADQNHELEMKKLEMQSNQSDEAPGECKSVHARLESMVAELSAKLTSMERKTSTISSDFDADDVERKVRKMQRQIKDLLDDR
tara:strand:- start:802 stop:1371 length:570 start_codon:yes stop_codon:yes gene_type:complete